MISDLWFHARGLWFWYVICSDLACAAFGVDFVLTGAPGIRRKFQQVEVPQLVVSATQKAGAPQRGPQSGAHPQRPLPTMHGPYAGHSKHSSRNNKPASTSNSDEIGGSGGSGGSSSSSSDNNRNSGSTTTSEAGPVAATEQPAATAEGLPEATDESRRRLWRLEDVREDTDIMERPKLAKG